MNFPKFKYYWPVIRNELFTSCLMSLWGIWLLSPVTTFSSSGYATFTIIASEGTWGFAMFVIGLVNVIAILTYRKRIRRLSAFFAFLIWAAIAIMFIEQNFWSTAVPTYLSIAIFSATNYLDI